MTSSPEPRRAPLSDRAIALGLFMVALAVYIATMCRTIYTGDDGDFITAIVTGGVPHPTGYPLFCLLGRLFVSLVPFGDPAFRVNLMTAFFGAGATAMLYRFLALLVPERLWAVVGTLIFAFGPTMWQQSLSCEVYSLNCLFLATILYLSLLWKHNPSDTRLLRVMTFVYGLSLTNHLSMALFLPGFLALVLRTRPALLGREWPVLLSLVPLFLLPLSLYAYLPLMVYRKASPVLWGSPSTPQLFWEHITGKQYRAFMFSSVESFQASLKRYVTQFLPGEFGLWLLWLAPVGLVSLLRKQPPAAETGERAAFSGLRTHGLLLVYIFLVNVLYSTNYRITDVYVYFLPSYLATTALMTVGASRLTHWAWRRFSVPTAERARLAGLAAPVLLMVGVVHMSLHWAGSDKSGNYIEADYAQNILAAAPPDAMVMVYHNQIFSLWYRQHVLKERPDVTCVNINLFQGAFTAGAWYFKHVRNRYPDLPKSLPYELPTSKLKSGEALAMVTRYALAHGRPVLIIPQTEENSAGTTPEAPEEDRASVGDGPQEFEEWIRRDFAMVPWGVGLRVFPTDGVPSAREVVRETVPLWEHLHQRGLFTGWASNDSQQQIIIFRYAEALVDFGKLAEEAGEYAIADNVYANALQLFIIPEAQAGRERCARQLARREGAGGAATATGVQEKDG